MIKMIRSTRRRIFLILSIVSIIYAAVIGFTYFDVLKEIVPQDEKDVKQTTLRASKSPLAGIPNEKKSPDDLEESKSKEDRREIGEEADLTNTGVEELKKYVSETNEQGQFLDTSKNVTNNIQSVAAIKAAGKNSVSNMNNHLMNPSHKANNDNDDKEQHETDQIDPEQPKEENILQGLWVGRQHDDKKVDTHTQNIHIVISYCYNDIGWITDFTDGYNISSVHIISKCDNPVENAPPDSTVEMLQNVGRNDHAYAYYITSILDSKIAQTNTNEENSVVIFLKDNQINHQPGHYWSSFDDLMELAASNRGFACGLIPQKLRYEDSFMHNSAYFNASILLDFHMRKYKGLNPNKKNQLIRFKSSYATLGHFLTSLNVKIEQELFQVCYGGSFAASVSNIKKVEGSVWKGFQNALSRADNIEEGHMMERSWGLLLSTPLTQSETSILSDFSTDTLPLKHLFGGALLKDIRTSRI